MMRWIGAITTLLLLDDLLQLHSVVFPRYIGGSKWVLIALEATGVLLWVARWSDEIVRTRWELLVAAGCGFASSLVVDRFGLGPGRWSLVLEDGAKALGVLAVATWAVSSALDLMRSLVDARADSVLRSRQNQPIAEGDRHIVSPSVHDLG